MFVHLLSRLLKLSSAHIINAYTTAYCGLGGYKKSSTCMYGISYIYVGT